MRIRTGAKAVTTRAAIATAAAGSMSGIPQWQTNSAAQTAAKPIRERTDMGRLRRGRRRLAAAGGRLSLT